MFILGPIKEKYRTKILEYLFPDSVKNSEFAYPEDLQMRQNSENFNQFKVDLAGIKSAPTDGIVWRLTVVISHCLHILGKQIQN